MHPTLKTLPSHPGRSSHLIGKNSRVFHHHLIYENKVYCSTIFRGKTEYLTCHSRRVFLLSLSIQSWVPAWSPHPNPTQPGFEAEDGSLAVTGPREARARPVVPAARQREPGSLACCTSAWDINAVVADYTASFDCRLHREAGRGKEDQN